MLICGVARSACTKRVPPDAPGDEVGRVGRDLHQPAGARVRGLVAEARLLVDDRGDQRRVEVLVGGLLADDVVVAQRQRDLAHRVAERARAGHARRRPTSGEHRRPAAHRARDAAAPGARLRRGATGDAGGGRELTAGSSLGKNAGQRLLQLVERAVVAHREVRTLRLLLLRELAAGALRDRRVPARAGALGRAPASSATTAIVCVEGGLHARLEQQRHLDDRRAGRRSIRLGPPGGHPLAHARPEHALEPGARLVVAEHPLGDPRAVERRRRAPPRARAARPRARAARRRPAARARRASVDSSAAPSSPSARAPPTCPRPGRR